MSRPAAPFPLVNMVDPSPSNASWSKGGVSITTGQTGPSGGTDAERLMETTENTTHAFWRYGIAHSGSVSYSLRVNAKDYNGSPDLYVQFTDSSFGKNTIASFGLDDGQVNSASYNDEAYFSGTDASMTALGDGWYSCRLDFTASALVDMLLVEVHLGSGWSSYPGSTDNGNLIHNVRLYAIG